MKTFRCGTCRGDVERGRCFCDGCGSQVAALPPGFAPVPPSWMQHPYLAHGRHREEVVGEGYRQHALLAAAGPKTEDGATVKWVMAQLVPEPGNPYDRDAVMVLVGPHMVGYLPRERTGPALQLIRQAAGRPVTVRAQITGGWRRENAGFGGVDEGHFGVRLWMCPDLRVHEPATQGFLPAECHVSVKVSKDAKELAERFVNRRGVVVVQSHGDAVYVGVAGAWVGTVSEKMAGRYAWALGELGTWGVPLTATAEASPGKTGPLLKVFLPLEDHLNELLGC